MDDMVHCFKLEYTIINQSNRTIVVRHKGGLGYIVAGSKDISYSQNTYLKIKVSSVMLDKLQIHPDTAYSKLDKVILEAMLKEKQRLFKDLDLYTTNYSPQNLNISLKLGADEMIEQNDSIHSELLGISLYIGGENRNLPAMNTPCFTLDELSKFAIEDFTTEDKGLRTFIYLNDPDQVIPKLYTNIIGNVVEVPSVSDSSRLPGLYMRVVGNKNSQLIPFYALDQITDDLLLKVGLYKNYGDCLKGPGNTERLVTAETQVKELTKEIEKFKNKITDLEELLNKSKEAHRKESRDLRKKIEQHEDDIYMYKLDTKHEMNMLKTKDLHNKYLVETIKAKASIGYTSDLVKNLTAVAGVIFTGYKLFLA